MFTYFKISKTKNHYIDVYPSPYSYYKLRKAIMDAKVEWKLNNIPRKSLGYLPHWNVVDNCLNLAFANVSLALKFSKDYE